MEHQDITRKAIQAAGEFHSRRLWKRFSNFDCFAVKTPGLDEPALAVVLGAAGEQYGLSLFRGAQAAASLAAVLEPEGMGDDALDEMDVLSFSMEPFGSLLPDAQDFLREAGLRPRYDEQVPSFLAKPPGREPRLADGSDLEHYLEEHAKQSVIVAYTSWGVLDYRPSKNSKTQAEKMLAAGLPEPQAMLLRARMEAYPTLYRVAGHDPKAGTIDLEDVLLGGGVTVYDQLMSENIEDGLFLPARVFPAGQFHFVEPIGPPLGEGMGLEAVEFLQSVRVEFTPAGLRREAHKFGWMWGWIEEWEANQVPPRLCNTDGDELLWHTASFSAAHPAEVREALLRRRDVEFDEEGDEFVWTKETGRGAKMLGGPVTMGRIELIDDELVLTANSAQRFVKARRWLEKLPGVAFRNVQTRPWDEDERDRPWDERMPEPEPVETPPEVIAHVRELMDRHYREWIDTSLPALGGQTPRQACRTAVGRQQVTMLIRTMPDPMGSEAVRAPREAMLRELGLAGEPKAAPSVSVPMHPSSESGQGITPERKVARNAPCPCGSGKKYKKCCGPSS